MPDLVEPHQVKPRALGKERASNPSDRGSRNDHCEPGDWKLTFFRATSRVAFCGALGHPWDADLWASLGSDMPRQDRATKFDQRSEHSESIAQN